MSRVMWVIFIMSPGMILLWGTIRSIRIGKFPLLWWIATIDRNDRPLLFVILIAILMIATSVAIILGAMLSWMAISPQR
jgi:hypothetical protein